MRFERCTFSEHDLARYAELFSACFPAAGKLGNAAYLQWLYTRSPLGQAVGFNAIDGDRLAAHYICTRALIELDGVATPALLSLNTATHPDYQGRGLFTRLAELTYEAGAAEGAGLVYGVANANSTPGFLRKLGFQLVEPLESRVGMGPLGRFDWPRMASAARLRQAWTPDYLAWRCANPANPVRITRMRDGHAGLVADTGRPMLRAWAEIPMAAAHGIAEPTTAPTFRVWLGLVPRGHGRFGLYPRLPERLRPSPLNLIFRPLAGQGALRAGESLFSFLDFDAF